MRRWIKHPLALFDGHAAADTGGLIVEGNLIKEVLRPGQVPQTAVEETFDASGHVVLPGLINTHHHYYQTLTRACPAALDKALSPWLKSLYPVWSGLTPEMISSSTRLASAELLLSGCTTSADHHYLFNAAISNAIDLQVAASLEMGIRFVATRGSMSLGKSSGGLPPDSVTQDEDRILADSKTLIQQYHDPRPGSMTQVALAPCSPFSVSQSLMKQSAALAEDLDVRLHTHLAETRDELAFCEREFGCSIVNYLDQVGWLQSRTWLAHGIFFSESEIQRLGSAGIGIAHCPGSNMMLGSGTCDLRSLQHAGCPVGLAVDGSASNDCSNMIQEVRQAFLLHRLQYGAAEFSHLDALALGTSGSAGCLGRADIGTIEPGKCADLALFKMDELRFSGAGDPLAALVLCHAHRASDVMVNGKWAVTDGELVGQDSSALAAQHQALAKRLQGIS